MHYGSFAAITAAAVSVAAPSKVTAQPVAEHSKSAIHEAAALPVYNLRATSGAPQPDAFRERTTVEGKMLAANQPTAPAAKWQTAFAGASEVAAAAVDDALRIAPEQRTKSAAYKWEAAFLALSAIDAAETISCLNRATCTEHNPIWGHHPSTGTTVAAKLGLGLVHFGVFKLIADRDPHTALRAAQISAAVQGGVVLLNLHTVF